jgi:putative transposase
MGRKDRKMKEEQSLAEALDIPEEVIEKLAGKVKTQADLDGPNGIMRKLFKAVVERAMHAELDHHLGYKKGDPGGQGTGNSRNGKGHKMIKGGFGELDIQTPRDRNGTFDPLLIPKRERRFKAMDGIILTL